MEAQPLATHAAVTANRFKPIPLEKASFLYQLMQMRGDLVGSLMRMEARHGPVWQIQMPSRSVVSMVGPDALELVLKNRDGAFSSARGWAYFIGRVFPGAIMAMDGEEHRYQRRIMQVAFRKSALQAYLGEMSRAVEFSVNRWLTPGTRADTVKIFPAFKQLTLDLAASVFMGVELGKNAAALNRAFVATVAASLALVRTAVPGMAMWRGVRGRKLLVERFRDLMPAKRATHTSDFFSEFCHAESEAGEKFTDEEIIDHMIFLMMAAHDTTTSTLTTMIYLLAEHPSWQERLREEVRALGKPRLDYDDLDRVEELSWVMREALRLRPPLTSMPRMCLRDTVFRDYLIPANTMVGVYPIHAHYSASLWTEPARFDPERFSPARQEDKRHAFAWAPFGGGVHMCIGQHFATLQVKAIMHQLLLKYRWSVERDYRMPYQWMPIARPRDGLPVKIERLH